MRIYGKKLIATIVATTMMLGSVQSAHAKPAPVTNTQHSAQQIAHPQPPNIMPLLHGLGIAIMITSIIKFLSGGSGSSSSHSHSNTNNDASSWGWSNHSNGSSNNGGNASGDEHGNSQLDPKTGRRKSNTVVMTELGEAYLSADPLSSSDIADIHRKVLQYINSYRTEYGLAPLRESSALNAAAQEYADKLAEPGAVFQHDPDLDANWENLLASFALTEDEDFMGHDTTLSWLKSKGHCVSMMAPSTGEFGLGIGYDSDQQKLIYVLRTSNDNGYSEEELKARTAQGERICQRWQ